MRDRQPIGNVVQQEVVEATCSSAQVPTVGVIVNGITPEPVGIITSPFFPGPSPGINNIPQPPPTGGKIKNFFFNSSMIIFIFLFSVPSAGFGYQPCVPTNEWYVSQPTIRCSTSFAATGFAPDPKDCSKYYACDGYVGSDGMSSGKINITKTTFSINYFDYINRYFNAMFGWFMVGSTTTNMCTPIRGCV
jgi:hypothetical protein